MSLANIASMTTHDDARSSCPEGTPEHAARLPCTMCASGCEALVFPKPGVRLCQRCAIRDNEAAKKARPRARYLGPCWETFQSADGTVALKKLYAYRLAGGTLGGFPAIGEIRYVLTEAEALEACAP